MGEILDNANTVYSNGPTSSPNNPPKSGIRSLWARIDAALSDLSLAVVSGDAIVKTTRALLFADLDHAANTLGFVINDATEAFNGIYIKSGASGAGSWSLTDLALPSTFASDLSDVQSDLALKADDDEVVKLTGDQTIAGTKTFSSAPGVPNNSFTIAKVAGLQDALDGAATGGDISAEAAARIAADEALQDDIDAEIAARIADVLAEEVARDAAIAVETAARTAADNTLQDNIENETAARIAAIDAEEVARDAAIAVETAARIAADLLLAPRDVTLMQRGTKAAATNISGITDIGIHRLQAGNAYTGVPTGFDQTHSHYLIVQRTGASDGTGTGTVARQTLFSTSISGSGVSSHFRSWSRRVEIANPTDTTGVNAWISDTPTEAIATDVALPRGTIADGTSLSDLTKPGTYWGTIAGVYPDRPAGTTGAFTLIVYNAGDGDFSTGELGESVGNLRYPQQIYIGANSINPNSRSEYRQSYHRAVDVQGTDFGTATKWLSMSEPVVMTGLETDDPDIVGGIFGEDGYVPIGFKTSGDIRTRGIDARGEVEADEFVVRVTDAEVNTYIGGFKDDDGRSPLGIEATGEVYLSPNAETARRIKIKMLSEPEVQFDAGHTVLTQTDVGGAEDYDLYVIERGGLTRGYLRRTDIASTSFVMNTDERIRYYPGSGQSLGVGGGADDEGGVIWNLIPPAPGTCLMFLGGARGVEGAAIPGGSLDDFTDIFEELDDEETPTKGETQGSGALSWSYRMALLNKEKVPVSVFRQHGKGGTPIAGLVQGSNPYARGLTEMAAAVSVAANYGKLIRCKVGFWTHGEDDRLVTSQVDYYNALTGLHTDQQTDWGALLPGDNGTIHMVLDQLSSSIASDAGPVALAQLQAARDVATIHLSTPKYMFEMVDFVHLKAKEYALLGEYNMRCARFIEEGGTWAPLWPTSVDLNSDVIDIVFNVPEGALEWNTRDLPEAEDYGFRVTDDDGDVEIVSVSIVGSDTVRIVTAVPPGTNPSVSYAFEGGAEITGRAKDWGNLISPSTDPSFQRPGRYLDHWCVSFKEDL